MDILKIQVEWQVRNEQDLREIIKVVSEIEKEYSCNCTLLVKQRPY